jgi:simple sugar transport system ATP-binding protein
MVHQHFMLVDNFTVLENVVLGSEGGALITESLSNARIELRRLANEYGLEVELDIAVEELSVGMQQRVEILKGLYKGAKVLILDEPTGVLTPQESDELFRIFEALKKQGVTIILITHKLREIMSITDHVSVMRGGKMVAHRETSQTNPEELAELMIGRKVLLNIKKSKAKIGNPVLVAKNLEIENEQGLKRVSNVSFEACSGEILGIAGVTGNGQGTLLKALAGILPISSGTIEIMGETITSKNTLNPEQLRNLGVAHVPEDRQRMGMISEFTASETALLGYHNDKNINQGVWLKRASVKANCESIMEAFDVRPNNPNLMSSNFSGGNQQKLILAREFERDPDVLIIGQPTRGVDIGAIEFIRKRIIDMRDAGKAIILISVELEEIMSLSDRIVVMCDGEITGTVNGTDADEATLGMMMANALESDDELTGVKS